MAAHLATETVEGAALPLEGVHDVHSGDGLSAGVFGVGDGILDDVLQEHLQHASNLLINETRDTLNTTSAGKTANCRLRDTLDVVAQHLAVALGASLSQPLSSFSSARHFGFLWNRHNRQSRCSL